jgi:hypothetical protein
MLSGAGLIGGKPGTTPTAVAATRREYNPNLFVDPMDYRWMRTYSDKPNVRVTVSGIPSACNTDCTYTFVNSVPVVTAASLSGYTLSLIISDPGSLNAPLSDITVLLDNQPCTNLQGTMVSFTCDLPKNSDDTPILTAGSHYPVVRVNPVGLVSLDPAINPIIIGLALTSVTSSSGGLNGGYEVTVSGKGFPQTTSQIDFTLCSKKCTLNSLNNIEAKLAVPDCATVGASDIQASYKTETATVSFTYTSISNSVEITSISPISWSPVMKGVMNITGTGFGTDPTQLRVFLTNSTGNIYEMKVLSVIDTFIKAGIPGGLPGKFDVNVIKTGFGYAIPNPTTANDFTYEVEITGISPSQGSVAGGTLITVSGKNFVPDKLDTLVHIGNELNQFCRIEEIS